MQDALLNRSLRLTVVGTISTLALICLILCYQALFDTICGNIPDAADKMTWGLTPESPPSCSFAIDVT